MTAQIIVEAGQLDAVGFALPGSVQDVALQKSKFFDMVARLTTMLQTYHTALSSLTPAEVTIFDSHLDNLLLALRPGLVALNWNSLNIPRFIEDSEKAINAFTQLVARVRSNSSMIDETVRVIESSSVVDASNIERTGKTLITDIYARIEGAQVSACVNV